MGNQHKPRAREIVSLSGRSAGSNTRRFARLILRRGILLLALGFGGTSQLAAAADTTFSRAVDSAVSELREEHELPALGALVFTADEETLAIKVDGVLRAGDSTPVLKDSLWHLGSNTKAMTATLAALLVEKGAIAWDTPVSEVLPKIAGDMHDGAKAITLVELLNHTAGLPADPPFEVKRTVIKAGNDLRKQRLELSKWALAQKPANSPGSTFLYSNVGYIIAGAMLEQAGGESWEKLIEEQLFEALGISSGGFGPPQGRQPEGHRVDAESGKLKPAGPRSDNPAFYGPAGTVHLSLAEWMKFGADHLREGRGELPSLLKPESYRRLHVPTEGAKDYAFGWGLYRGPAGTLPVLSHDGSNTEWYARIMLNRQAGLGILLVSNAGSDQARPAINALAKRISEALQALPKS